ncbi:MAG: DUF3892 domain-containing protein [Solirubrobacteraceae bacterium]
MAQEVRVRCINKTPRQDPHLRISHIGGVNNDGSRWRMTETAAIKAIKAGEYAFYVEASGVRVNVVIATREGHEYLKTRADGVRPDNLLALPECPR